MYVGMNLGFCGGGSEHFLFVCLVLFSEGLFCLSFVCFFSSLPALPLFYLHGEHAEAVLGIAWGLSFASCF